MNKIVAITLTALLLTGCTPRAEYVQPKITHGVPKQLGPSDTESEKVAEAQREVERKQAEAEAESLRLAAEAAERQRIADLEAENQRQQKAAEEARLAEIERKQQEAADQLAKRLEQTPKQDVAAPPAPEQVAPPSVPTPQWITALMNFRGYHAPANTIFLVTDDMGMCTSIIANPGGCTTIYADGRIEVRLKTVDEFVLFHEIAHANGITDECAADAKAREVTGREVYLNCS